MFIPGTYSQVLYPGREGERLYRDVRYLPHQEVDSALLGNVVPYNLEFIQGILVPLHGHKDIGPLEGSLGGGKYP